MPPLVSALKGPDHLVRLALRILEYWIDSLNPEFLEPAMAGVSTQLLSALISHLKPEPYPFGAKSLQLLGKLGGRNRRFLKVGACHESDELHAVYAILLLLWAEGKDGYVHACQRRTPKTCLRV